MSACQAGKGPNRYRGGVPRNFKAWDESPLWDNLKKEKEKHEISKNEKNSRNSKSS